MDADGQDENNMSPQGEGRDIIKNDLFNQLMVDVCLFYRNVFNLGRLWGAICMFVYFTGMCLTFEGYGVPSVCLFILQECV
jgi:hypothetical protein